MGIFSFLALIIRFVLPLLALAIIISGFSSLRYNRRSEGALIVLEDEFNHELYPVLYWENSIGRSRGSDIRLYDNTVSRDHAVLLRREAGWFVTDTGSKAGVTVNGEYVTGRTPVYINDKIGIGTTILTLKRADDYGDEAREEHLSKSSRKVKRTAAPAFLLFLVTIFMLLLTAEVSINLKSFDILPVGFGFMAFMWIFFIITRLATGRRSFELETLALFITGIGVILSGSHEIRQAWVQLAAAVCGAIGFCLLIKFIEIPDRVMKWRLIITIIAVGVLAANLVFGRVTHGAANWIVIGPISIQPSEFVKIAYIFVGASTLDALLTKKNLTEFIIFTAVCIGALFIMSDLGTALIFFVTFLVIAFMRSGDIKTVILAVSAAVFGGVVVLTAKPYIADRFATWGHVWDYAADEGYQQVNTLIYSASGGLFGVGCGNGNLQYIFASESDLVFGLLCEELGLIIALLTVVALVGLVVYARAVTTRSRSSFYSIAACSAAGLLAFQAMLNIFGSTDILPLTGVTLPFISEGGSSMISCWCLLAFIKAADERTYAMRKKHHSKQKQQAQQAVNEEEEFVEI